MGADPDSLFQDPPRNTEEWIALLYDELRRLASSKLRQEHANQALQTTELVHEAYMRLVGSDRQLSWDNRRHFFSAAAESMRRILIDGARRRQATKYGAQLRAVDLDKACPVQKVPDRDILSLSEAIDDFHEISPDKCELVKLRFFAGMTNAQAADVLGISQASADRHWAYARAWLHDSIKKDQNE